jgi:hemerythrin superfamily protein
VKPKTPAKGRTATKPRSNQRPVNEQKGVVSRMVESVTNVFTTADTTNAIELLKTDHRRVDDLFTRVKENEDGNNEDVFRQINNELDLHAHVEEMIFYPHLLENGDEELQKIVREGIEEHSVVKTLLAELEELSGTSDDFKAKIKVLMENVEHHVEEEEDEMFPLVEDQIEEETLNRLGALIEGEKSKFTRGTARTATAR